MTNGFHLENLRRDVLPVHKHAALTGAMTYKEAWVAVKDGRVSVDGVVATTESKCDRHQIVACDGTTLPARQPLVYYLLYKPRCVLTSCGVGNLAKEGERAKGEMSGGIITDWVPCTPRVVPVGRLDYESEGAIILSNDGSLCKAIMSPSFAMLKEYVCLVVSRKHPGRPGIPTKDDLDKVTEGTRNEQSGTLYQAERAVLEDADSTSGYALVRVSLREGKNREVRRLMQDIGFRVLTLTRVTIGPLHEVVDRPKTVLEAAAAYERLEKAARDAQAVGESVGGSGKGLSRKRRKQAAHAQAAHAQASISNNIETNESNGTTIQDGSDCVGGGCAEHPTRPLALESGSKCNDSALGKRSCDEDTQSQSQSQSQSQAQSQSQSQSQSQAQSQSQSQETRKGPGCRFTGFVPSTAASLTAGQVRVLTATEVDLLYAMTIDKCEAQTERVDSGGSGKGAVEV